MVNQKFKCSFKKQGTEDDSKMDFIILAKAQKQLGRRVNTVATRLTKL